MSIAAAASTSRTRKRFPTWKPWSGRSSDSHPNQEKNAPTITAKSPRPTKPNSPATTRRPRPRNAKAKTSATIQKSTDQPANAPWPWSSEITESQAIAATSAVSAPVYAKKDPVIQAARFTTTR
jgi:hypothetical protein